MKTTVLSLLFLGLLSCAAPQQQLPPQVQILNPEQFKDQRMGRKTMLVDVRTPEEFAAGHLDGAINSDFRGGAFAEEIKDWNKNKVYYLYCASGNRSGKASELMKEAGFKHIYNIGGFPALKEAGLPTEAGSEQ
ncbi:rhodanese-like domain-containing protein [Pontibacter sp. CAU 1760]